MKGPLFSGSTYVLTHLPKKSCRQTSTKVDILDAFKTSAKRICKTSVADPYPFSPLRRIIILANDDAEHDIPRAIVHYAPLYPTFKERLNRFRQGEQSDLRQRGAERVVDNVGIYGSQRSFEDASVEFVAVHPEDLITTGPSEAAIKAEQDDISISNSRLSKGKVDE